MLAQCGQAEVQSKGRGVPAELAGMCMSHVACRAPAVYEVPPGSCVWGTSEAVLVQSRARNQGAVEEWEEEGVEGLGRHRSAG